MFGVFLYFEEGFPCQLHVPFVFTEKGRIGQRGFRIQIDFGAIRKIDGCCHSRICFYFDHLCDLSWRGSKVLNSESDKKRDKKNSCRPLYPGKPGYMRRSLTHFTAYGSQSFLHIHLRLHLHRPHDLVDGIHLFDNPVILFRLPDPFLHHPAFLYRCLTGTIPGKELFYLISIECFHLRFYACLYIRQGKSDRLLNGIALFFIFFFFGKKTIFAVKENIV